MPTSLFASRGAHDTGGAAADPGRLAAAADRLGGAVVTAAVDAAAALADELSRADAATAPLAFELYEQRCRRILVRNRAAARRLARVMFVRHRLLPRARDQLVRLYPGKLALGAIISSVHHPL